MPTSVPNVQLLSSHYVERAPALAAVFPVLARTLRTDEEAGELAELLNDALAAAPDIGPALASHLELALSRLGVPGLRRWILTGMRLYENHTAKLVSYFRLDDPAAVQSMEAESHGVAFEPLRNMLKLYLAGFGQADIDVNARVQRQMNAPPLRVAISDGMLLFPEHYLASDGGQRGAIYRAAAAHAIAHLRHSPRHQKVGRRKPLLLAMLSLVEDARVERLMSLEYPGLAALWGRFHVASGSAGDLGFSSLSARLARALHDPGYEDPNHWVNKGRDLFEAVANRLESPSPFVEVGSILANDLGQMRVRFNPQRYVVEPAYRDDNSILWEYDGDPPDTMPEESLARQSVQVDPSQADTDQVMHVSPVEIKSGMRWHYPEWDYRVQSRRERWTTVIDESEGEKAARSGAGRTNQGPRSVSLDTRARLLDRAVRLQRQHEGEELDLNAAIDCRISQRARIAPDPRIFQRPGKRRRHASILLLLDLSESTNDRVAGTFTSLLDLEKRAACLVADSLDAGHDRLAIDGFCSDGREKVHYMRMKDFDEPFGLAQRHALMCRQGALSTRIGAALRHAGMRLATEPTEKKILLLVTDGEPSDIDVADRSYLVEDARDAANALAANGIATFCLTLDPRADRYVKTIFGLWNYLIVDNPVRLPAQMSRALTMMAAR